MGEWKPMERSLHKELWGIRFQKMLAMEKGAVGDYADLIKQCDQLFKTGNTQHPLKTQLEGILKDEGKHIKLIEELLSILEKQKTD